MLLDPEDERWPLLLERFLACQFQDGQQLLELVANESAPQRSKPSDIGTWRDWAFRLSDLWTGLDDDGATPLDWAADAMLWDALTLELERSPDAVVRGGDGPTRPVPEPHSSHWRAPAVYKSWLEGIFVRSAEQYQRPPAWLQIALLQHLHWYFVVDARERAPTVTLREADADAFHALMERILARIDRHVLRACADRFLSQEVFHALLSYQCPVEHSVPRFDRYDPSERIARLTYFIHGEPPLEQWGVDGIQQAPRYAKYRACNYFYRRLFRQRIAWYGVPSGSRLELVLAEQRVDIELQRSDADGGVFKLVKAGSLTGDQLASLPARPTGQRRIPWTLQGVKARLLHLMAALPWVSRRYRDAWVLVDRDIGADDSAEHLYRHLRTNRPEINIWYLLHPDSSDWQRLHDEGFKLMPLGLQRRLLALNCRHVISSHTGMEFGLDRTLHGDWMRWCYSFLQHGTIKDDLSHWLGPCDFDRFITSSPAEHQSIVADDTPYPYTDKEVRCTGLPRHDRLLRYAATAEGAKYLLIMPTWRAGLVDARTPAPLQATRFASSRYARIWRELLNREELKTIAAQAGWQIVFMPHANAGQFMEAFEPPPYVELVSTDIGSMQTALAGAAGFVTDYTSVAFDMALLRRPVFYLQFDREDFFNGGHNWRPGYFDYDRDGFGPVSQSVDELLAQLASHVARGASVGPPYLERMQGAMPLTDGKACERVFQSIVEMDGVATPGR
ncbi:MAG: CDP-glycerol glycerophosphotransferase family protein [Rubrivivax sp.]